MIFQRVNRTDPERIFVVMQANASGIAKDDVVALETTAGSADGIKIVQPASGQLFATLGVADNAIANADYGLVQVYGYRSTSRIFQTNTSIDTATPLVAVAGQDYWQSVASSTTSTSNVTGQPVLAVLLESVASSSASASISCKIFIRAL